MSRMPTNDEGQWGELFAMPLVHRFDKLRETATVGRGPGNLRARNLKAERRLEITNQGSPGPFPYTAVVVSP